MRNITILLSSMLLFIVGCSSAANESLDTKVLPVDTELIKEDGLDEWKVSLLPGVNSLGQQGYELSVQNKSDASIENVTIYYRVDSKEKLSAQTVKADSQTVISKLDSNESITLSDLSLPIGTPIQVEVDWQVGTTIRRGTGTFQITESK